MFQSTSNSADTVSALEMMDSNTEHHDHELDDRQNNVTYPTTIDGYNIEEMVGRGTHSTIWSAHCGTKNRNVAIKKINMDNLKVDDIQNLFQNEVNMLSISRHPNIVTYRTSFTDGVHLYVVTDLLDGGSMSDIMSRKFTSGIHDERLVATILKNILKALCYMHKTSHVHRDVKLSNVFVDSSGKFQLGDFALSIPLFEDGHRIKSSFELASNSFCWMAPEVFSQNAGYDYKADIWSFGITALELAYGTAPLSDLLPMQIMYHVMNESPPKLVDQEDFCWSSSFHDLITKVLQSNPDKRPNAAELMEHKFFKKAMSDTDAVEMLLKNTRLPAHIAGNANPTDYKGFEDEDGDTSKIACDTADEWSWEEDKDRIPYLLSPIVNTSNI
ncbi:hypothetical protein AKO1_008007 [Acrasis kona]|uniref:Protein kinase domain-containing protein n=1 Tax=Acrasis kona TaxID=1008807 RepID=A0AAW2YP50_9EUKA